MKMTQKWILAVAASLSMGTAIAATASSEALLSGTGTLDFQDNMLREAGLLRISTTSKIAAPGSLPPNTANYDPSTRTVALNFDSASISAADGKASFSATNSYLELYLLHSLDDENGDPLPPTLNLITLKNISFDLSDASVSANVGSYYGTSMSAPVVSDFGRLQVFKGMAPITDGTQGLIVNGQVSGSTVGGLMLTSSAADIVINALYGAPGMPVDRQSTIYQVASTMSWATASASATFASSVPEASTSWLMFMGLLAILAPIFSRRSPR
jgi:hypothetical protein